MQRRRSTPDPSLRLNNGFAQDDASKWKLKLSHQWSAICLAFTWRLTYGLGGTEFSGGRITGPLLAMSDFAILLFLLSTILVWWLPRIMAMLTTLACLLCLPLCFLFLAPGPFRRIAGGVWSVPLQSNFVLTLSTLGWALILIVMLGVSIWNLAVVGPKVWATSQ